MQSTALDSAGSNYVWIGLSEQKLNHY